MADKRMMTKKITDDDHFQNLSSSAQALYLHLTLSADDDGFCNQVNASMFKAHASVQDLEALLAARYLIQFENGVIVIKHWRMANALRKDRYTPTVFQEELSRLKLKENGAYTERDDVVAAWLPSGCQTVAADKNRLDKNRLDKSIETKTASRFTPPKVEEVAEYCKERKNGIDPQRFVDYYDARGWTYGKGTKMRDWKAAVRLWERGNSKDAHKDGYFSDSISEADIAAFMGG